MFIAGRPRRELPVECLLRIASFRFVPAVETTIEVKHQRVSLARRAHHIGGVRISLSNRLGMLQRWLAQEYITAQELSRAFNQTRSLKSVPYSLGFDEHPLLGSKIKSYQASLDANSVVANYVPL